MIKFGLLAGIWTIFAHSNKPKILLIRCRRIFFPSFYWYSKILKILYH
jgi:hypothetical protein